MAGLGAIEQSVRAATANPLGTANLRRQGELATARVVRLPEGEPVSFDPGVTRGGRGLEPLQNLFEGLVFIDQRNGSLQMGVAEKMDFNDADRVHLHRPRRRDLVGWHAAQRSRLRVELEAGARPGNEVGVHLGALSAQECGQDRQRRAIARRSWRESGRRLPPAGDAGGTDTVLPLLAATWTFYPVPRHVVEQFGEAWVEAGAMVSNGPYILTAWEHDQRMTLERNELYYGAKPTITRADYTLFDNHMTQALVAFENDELDQHITGTDLERVQSDPVMGPLMKVFPRSGTAFAVCDTTNPPTDSLQVRQALSMAISATSWPTESSRASSCRR